MDKKKPKRKEKENALDEMLIEEFISVKSSFLNQAVFGPDIIDEDDPTGVSTAAIDFCTRRICINPGFVKDLSDGGDMRKIVRGLYSHEFGHYVFHPADMSMQLFLSYTAKKAFNELAQAIYPMYIDFQDDLLIYNNDFNREDLKELEIAQYKIDNGPVNDAIYGVYRDRFGLDLEIDLSRYEEAERKKILHATDELKKIDIRQVDVSSRFDYQIQNAQLMQFGDIMKPLIEMEKKYKKAGKGGEGDSSGGSGKGTGPKMLTPEDFKNMDPDVKQKLEEEMKKLIKSLPKEMYDQLKDHYLGPPENKPKGQGIGLGTTDTMDAEKKTIDYYRQAASAYGFIIRQKRIVGLSSININYGKKDYSPNDNAMDSDLTFSGGKIYPGLSKTKTKMKIPYPKKNDFTPRALIYKDVSGSMDNPITSKCFGTIGISIIALSYLRNGAEVGIVLFDSNSDEAVFSRKEDEIMKKLCSYKGGGTHVNMEQLVKDLEKSSGFLPFDRNLKPEELQNNPFFKKHLEGIRKDPKYIEKNAKITGFNKIKKESATDFYIMTDGGIANMEELITFFGANPGYRPVILHCGNFSINLPGYDQKTDGIYNGIRVYKADNEEDIVRIAKQSVKNNFSS